MVVLYRNSAEYRQHTDAIQWLASRYHVSEYKVREIYECVLGEFISKSRLKNFIGILVTRRVQKLLASSDTFRCNKDVM